MNKEWLILDANYLCHRAKYIMGDLSWEGSLTGVVYGFLNDISVFQGLFDTSNVIFCWDSRTSKREEIFSGYKLSRKSKYEKMTASEIRFEEEFKAQMKRLRTEYLREIGFKNVFWQAGYESDDIIASVCQNLPKGDRAIIVSSDKDLYQLIQHNISFYNPQKRKTLTLQGFKKQYGILPHEWKMVKAIAGCSTDGVPGIKGVGEKTVIKYLQKKLKRVKLHERIVSKEGQKIFVRNMKLVALPFKGTKVFKLSRDRLSREGWRNVTGKLGMKSIKDEFPFGRRRR